VVVYLVVALVEEEDINMANTFKFGNENWAVKDGKVLAYNDENNAFKPLPFTFARSSSATRVDNEGLIKTTDSGFARIDFLNNTSGHLLLEPSRTNLLTYSEDFSQWTPIGTPTVDLNNIVSPDGNLNGTKITRGSNVTPLRKSTSDILNNAHTFTLYAKKGNYDKLGLDIGDEEQINFTLTDEWQRFEVTSTPTTYNHVDITLPLSSSGDYIYIFGAQLEAGSFPTSYIPTTGSTVTRAAETCNSAGNSTVFNDSEGVLYAEISAFINGGGGDRTISISDGSQSNSIQLLLHNTASRINFRVRDGGSLEVNISDLETNQTLDLKVACKYKSGDYSLFVNGTKKATTTSGNLPTGLNQLAFDDGAYNDFYGKVKNIQVYNTALTDAELIELTS
jgi:hypothetical protein